MSPYRGQERVAGPCPMCGRELELNDVGGCAHGCGIWIPAGRYLDSLHELGEEIMKNLIGVAKLPCPRCATTMMRRYWEGSRFAVCEQHGAFVEQDYASRMLQRLDAEILVLERRSQMKTREPVAPARDERQRRIDELVAAMTAPDGRRALAKWIVELEERVAKLEHGDS